MNMAPYFPLSPDRVNFRTLRECQCEALAALGKFFGRTDRSAACVMSVGAGKTALGVAACLLFTERRALILTPGRIIRGTFERAFDPESPDNILYGLPGGPLLPGIPPPRVLILDRSDGSISSVSREEMLRADIIVTNFHSLGGGRREDGLLAKLAADDIDLVVVDEAHMAAARSYQRAFRHFAAARTILMSACFQRYDGRGIDTEVVYRYRLIDAIADGHAKTPRLSRHRPFGQETEYEIAWPDGRREEIVGRDSLLAILEDERKLAHATAKSTESIRQVMGLVKHRLVEQEALLSPVKPRVLFAALGEQHARQIAEVAVESGLPTAYVHHSMGDEQIRSVRQRFESDWGDLQGIVQLHMLGQGYDFPPITVVVPMRPYGSFAPFYQFVGRGIRVIRDPILDEVLGPGGQFLDIVYHTELGLDEHIETLFRENDMDPSDYLGGPRIGEVRDETETSETVAYPEAVVLNDRGLIEQRFLHDEARVARRQRERERQVLARQYAEYVQTEDDPVSFAGFEELIRAFSD